MRALRLLLVAGLIGLCLSDESLSTEEGLLLPATAYVQVADEPVVFALETRCPDGCVAGKCVAGTAANATAEPLRCLECAGSLLVSRVTGQCVCPAGRYAPSGQPECVDCPKGSYCAGGLYNPTGQPPTTPNATVCPASMTTLGLRSISDRQCVNAPGFAYTLDANNKPGVVPCGVNEYGPGLRKQRACVKCPDLTSTLGKVEATSPRDCLVPGGYFLEAPGLVAACPQGEFKADASRSDVRTNCTKCSSITPGVTTNGTAATSQAFCKVLLPGYYARELASDGSVKRAALCPQKYVCPGGVPGAVFDPSNSNALPATETTIKPCANGMWTVSLGSTDPAQCLTPPGHFTANGTTQPCPPTSYRAGWEANAVACQSCGDGVMADKTESITVNNLLTNRNTSLAVATSVQGCYIQPGQGLVQLPTQIWQAQNCNSGSNYGVANRTYGLTANPCKDCPAGQVTSSSSPFFVKNPDGSGGFTSAQACGAPGQGGGTNGTTPGTNGTSLQCPTGSYGVSQPNCTQCSLGKTTAGPGAALTAADCGVAAGFGNVNGTIKLCPNGTYNPVSWSPPGNGTVGCSPCPANVTTAKEGAVSPSECNVLLPGYYARELAADGSVKHAALCPQKYICVGGVPGSVFDPSNATALPATETTIKPCASGMWTVGLGSTDPAQCLTPPGHFTANGTTQPCPPTSYRAAWEANAASCQSCGDGVMADKRDQVAVYSLPNNTVSFLNVTASTADCYIQPGQGLVQTANQTWQAVNCSSGANYGVAERTYNLTANPCRACPPGQITSSNSSQYPTSASYFVRNPDGSGGFTSPKACVNPGGFGNGTACPQGTYSAPDSRGNCTGVCPYGFTTAGPGAGVTAADCGVAAGFGNVNGTVKLCPIGTYNNVSWSPGNTTTCTSCPASTTTLKEGAASPSECKVLAPGYYARELAADGSVKRAALCPQKYICAGGVPGSAFDPSNSTALPATELTIKLCASGAWTVSLGSTDPAQCLTPPGHFTAGGTTQPCGAGASRSGWQAPANAASCQSCGDGVMADKRDLVAVYSLPNNTVSFLNVTTSAADCYIQPGQGLVQLANQAWQAVNCSSGANYGVAERTYNLTANPCRACPAGQITSSNSSQYPTSASYFVRNPDGSGGFTSPKACVNPAGSGFDGTAAVKCAKGSYSLGDSYGPCLPCSTNRATFTYTQAQADPFQSNATSKVGTDSPCLCLTEWQQLANDAQWYIRLNASLNPLTTNSSADTFKECVAQCTGPNCMWATFDYVTKRCFTRNVPSTVDPNAATVAIRALLSGDPPVGQTCPAASSYSVYRDPSVSEVLGTEAAPGREGFTTTQDCLTACDKDNRCAGVILLSQPTNPRSCSLIKGDTTATASRRTATRTDVTRLYS